jgi:cell division protein FtsW
MQLRPGHGVTLSVLALLLVGVVMVNSVWLARSVGESAAALSGEPAADPITAASLLWGRPTLYAIFAMLALAVGASLPMRLFEDAEGRPRVWPIAAVGLVTSLLLAAVYLPGVGREVNGAHRWIEIGPLTLQPSELAKWAMPLFLAWWCVRPGTDLSTLRRGFLPAIAVVFAVGAIVGIEDLGTAVLIVGVSGLVLLAAGVRWRHVLLLVPVGAAAVVGAIIQSPYRVKRLLAWQDPFADPQGIGYHVIQSLSAISGGGLAGRGLGQGVQKFGYLPEGTTDFIFAIICEELGLAGAAVVVGLIVGLLWCGISIIAPRGEAAAVPTRFQRLLGLAILLTIGLQALINVTVVTGLAPTKGIALPFVSSGGTGWVLTAFSVGLLLAIERDAIRRAAPASSTLAEEHDSTSVPAGAAVSVSG